MTGATMNAQHVALFTQKRHPEIKIAGNRSGEGLAVSGRVPITSKLSIHEGRAPLQLAPPTRAPFAQQVKHRDDSQPGEQDRSAKPQKNASMGLTTKKPPVN